VLRCWRAALILPFSQSLDVKDGRSSALASPLHASSSARASTGSAGPIASENLGGTALPLLLPLLPPPLSPAALTRSLSDAAHSRLTSSSQG